MINKELNLTEDDFCNQITNDIVGKDFITQLEFSMMLIQSKFKQMHIREYNEFITQNTFDKAFILHDALNQDLKFFAPFNDFQVTPDIIPNLNIKIWQFGDAIHLSKVKEMTLQERRGLKINKKHAFKISYAFFNKKTDSFYGTTEGFEVNPDFFKIDLSIIDENTYKKFPSPISLNPNYGFYDNPIRYLSPDVIVMHIKHLAMAYQIALSMYYEWTLYIKEYDNIGIVVPIHPSILKELYNTSMVNFEDRKRMIHFVSEHYRRKIALPSEDYSIYVKKYLRGENKFNYRGFKTEIIPPKYDLNRIKTRKKFTDVIS